MIEFPAPLPGRPFYITIDGGRIYVSVHDTYHVERERQFKRAGVVERNELNQPQGGLNPTAHVESP